MFDYEVYSYPITKILLEFGVVQSYSKDRYYSPFRSEHVASLHVNIKSNTWYDHSIESGGTNVQLVQVLKHCSPQEAIDYIKGQMATATSPMRQRLQPVSTTSIEVVMVGDLSIPFLIEYIEGRGIPIAIARRYCLEVITQNPAKHRRYNVIGFMNNNGGLCLKGPTGFKSTTKDGITTIDRNGTRTLVASSGAAAVFEGFFDFLSYLVLKGQEVPGVDIVVLNSVNNLSRALPYLKIHSSIEAYLDNDDSGRQCLANMRTAMPGVSVMDRSSIYEGYSDFNDFLLAMIKAQKG